MKKVFDSLVEAYESKENLCFYSRIARNLCNLIRENLDKDPKLILELGIGTGIATRELFGFFPKTKVVGVDISLGMLKRLSLRKTLVICGDIREVRFKKSFDVIFSNFCLHWTFSERFLEELTSLLSQGGVFAFSIPLNPCAKERGNLILAKILLKLKLKDRCSTIKRERIFQFAKERGAFCKVETFKEVYPPDKLLKLLKSRGSWSFMFDGSEVEAEVLWNKFTKDLSLVPLTWQVCYCVLKRF